MVRSVHSGLWSRQQSVAWLRKSCSVLRQETSRTACVYSYLGGRSSVGSQDHRFHQILFSTLGACYKADNIGRLTTSVAPKLDCCPRHWLRDLCGGYHFAGFASCFAARSCLPKRTDWLPLQTGLSETVNVVCRWESTATKERRPTFL